MALVLGCLGMLLRWAKAKIKEAKFGTSLGGKYELACIGRPASASRAKVLSLMVRAYAHAVFLRLRVCRRRRGDLHVPREGSLACDVHRDRGRRIRNNSAGERAGHAA